LTASPPPPHRIRFSRRAKRISLRVSPYRGLEVVLPADADPACVPQMLIRHGRWITKHLGRYPATDRVCPFPRHIALKGGREVVPVHQTQWRQLREWTREQARSWLGPMLAELAGKYGFSFASMRMRFQKSRWGSCSSKGCISLNACLVFLPESLARYILLHELCHTRQMNHSDAFWQLLLAHDPDARAHDRAMSKAAWSYVPDWVYFKG